MARRRNCSGCGVRLVLEANWTPGRAKAGHYICRSCTSARQQARKERIGLDTYRKTAARQAKERRLRDPYKYRLDKFAYRLRKQYGMTLEEYHALIAKQGGGCAICREELSSDFQVHTDHCHQSGKVRGVLCQKCNLGLGHFRDDTKLLRAAIGYLIDPPNA